MRVLVKYAVAALAVLLPLKVEAESYTALYRGIVVSSVDPASHYRLKVRVPDLSNAVLDWASPSVSYDGDTVPIFVPPAGSRVWILFEEGDIHRPVWIGWIPGTAPPGGDPIAAPPSGQ